MNAIPRMVDNGRGQEAAKRLLGAVLEVALVSDQYADYRFINSEQRQLCWAYMLRNVVAIVEKTGSSRFKPRELINWSGIVIITI